MPQPVRLNVGTVQVSGLSMHPPAARACLVLAHGAGAGMQHPFMADIAAELARRAVATLRFEFPYMARGARRPDPPALAQAVVRAAVGEASRRFPGAPLLAGGKSFGGRMTSLAQAQSPLEGVCGLVFFGFPLHPAGRPSTARARHLGEIHVPMLFLQGTHDKLADATLMQAVARDLGQAARMHWVEAADHAFHVPVRSGRTDIQVRADLGEAVSRWLRDIVSV